MTSFAVDKPGGGGLLLTPGNHVLLTAQLADSATDARGMLLQVWDLKTAKAGRPRVLTSFTRELAPSWDGQSLAVRSGRSRIAITDLATGKDLARIEKDLARVHQLTTKELALNPGNAALLSELGQLYLRLGEPQRALHWLYQALERDPKHRPTHELLVQYWESLGTSEGKARAESHRQALKPSP